MEANKYTTNFKTHDEYNDFLASSEFIEPNVSHCDDEDHVHYNPPRNYVELIYYGVYDAPQLSRAHMILNHNCDTSLIDYIDVDGIKYSGDDLTQFCDVGTGVIHPGSFRFSGEGRHSLKIYYKDYTKFPPDSLSYWCSATKIILPTTITELDAEGSTIMRSIGTNHFEEDFTLVIPKNIKRIHGGDEEFSNFAIERLEVNGVVFQGPIKLESGAMTLAFRENNAKVIIPEYVEFDDYAGIQGASGYYAEFDVYCPKIGKDTFNGNVWKVTFHHKDFNFLPAYSLANCENPRGGRSLSEVILPQNHVVELEDDTVFAHATPGSYSDFKVYVPCDLVDAYKTNPTWNTFKNRIRPISETIECDVPKGVIEYVDGTTYEIPCDCTKVLMQTNIQGGTEDIANIKKVTIPDDTIDFDSSLFKDCTSLEEVNIPTGMTVISGSCFNGCTSLQTFNIPNNIETIAASAFAGCTSLTSITIGTGLTSLRARAFYGCTALESITINAVTPPVVANTSAFPKVDGEYTDFKVYVPADSVEAYKAAPKWEEIADKIFAQ